MLSLAKCDRKHFGIYHATKAAVFLDSGQDSRSWRLDEERISRLQSNIECCNGSMSAAPVAVKDFKDSSTSTTVDEPLSAETESTVEDRKCSRGAQLPSTVTSAYTNTKESNSSEADSRSSQADTSTMYTVGHERTALDTSEIESLYKSVVMDIEKDGRGLGASGIATSISAVACN